MAIYDSSAKETAKTANMRGFVVRLANGQEFTVERHNGYVLSGFCHATHSFMALRNDDCIVVSLPDWERILKEGF